MNEAVTFDHRFKAKLLVVGGGDAFYRHISGIFTDKTCHITGRDDIELSYSVHSALNVDEALTIVEYIHPDILLIASTLSGANYLIKTIRDTEEKRHTGIIIIDQLRNDGATIDSLESFSLGVDDFIGTDKPVQEVVARIEAAIRLKFMTDELRLANHRLEILSNTDDLTGLYNMRYFQRFYQQLVGLSRTQYDYGVIMLDLDRFKSINDNTNHLVGSYIIGEIGKLMQHSHTFGSEACLARYGGDEYIIASKTASIEDLCHRAERLRSLIETSIFVVEEFEIKITASIGVCFIDRTFSGDANDPIKAADLMLYESKEKGRNRVSSVTLRDSIDFDHIRRDHFAHRDASGDHNGVPRFNYIKILK